MSSRSQIGLVALTALVISSMIGSGIFSLPQNMAAVAGSQALLIGWLITGIGIIFLGLSFASLSKLRPDLDGGIYTYSRDGFGDLMGFFSAWGYWLCTTVGIVGYLVVAFEAIGTFTDTPDRVLFGQGNTLYSFIGASAVAWLIHWLVAAAVIANWRIAENAEHAASQEARSAIMGNHFALGVLIFIAVVMLYATYMNRADADPQVPPPASADDADDAPR